jgi:hypothetical protein
MVASLVPALLADRRRILPVGMGFAVRSGVRFNTGRDEDIRVSRPVPGPATVTGLDEAERHTLADWLEGARGRGIDMVMDFSVRDWNVAGVAAIVGVFEADKYAATWLVVRNGSSWFLARCSDGLVSGGSKSLAHVLGLIDEEPVA